MTGPSLPEPSKTPPAETEPESAPGVLGLLVLLIGGGCLVFALIGVINTAFKLRLSLRVYGSRTAPPYGTSTATELAAEKRWPLTLQVLAGAQGDSAGAPPR